MIIFQKWYLPLIVRAPKKKTLDWFHLCWLWW